MDAGESAHPNTSSEWGTPKRTIFSHSCRPLPLLTFLFIGFISNPLSSRMVTRGAFLPTAHVPCPSVTRHLARLGTTSLCSTTTARTIRRWLFSSVSEENASTSDDEHSIHQQVASVKVQPHHTHILQQKSSELTVCQDFLVDPMELVNFTIPYPKSLSPSSAMEFKACPQSYFFQYLLGIKQPPNEALAKGTMCHAALQKIFDIAPSERSIDTLKNLLRTCWKEKRFEPPYQDLFQISSDERPLVIFPKELELSTAASDAVGERVRDLDAERKWGTEALELLQNYYELEDPRNVLFPNPYRREMWITAKLAVDPSQGTTFRGISINKNNNNNIMVGSSNNTYCNSLEEIDSNIEKNNKTVTKGENQGASFLVRGIIDRLDYVRLQDGQIVLRLIDYKTSKSPNFKYSKAMNVKIAEESFWQLKVYALLLRESLGGLRNKDTSVVAAGKDGTSANVRFLRLMYLTSDNGKAQYIDMDLGRTAEQRDEILSMIHSDLSKVWAQIYSLVQLQDAKVFHHCDRPFCFCHRVRPYLKPESVWNAKIHSYH
jgi:RecB family exonuclease